MDIWHIVGTYWPEFLRGIVVTLKYILTGFVGALVLGLLLALGRVQALRVISIPCMLYVEFFKNVPILAGIFLIYYGLPSVGILVPTFLSGWLSLTLFYGAYMGEIFRGGLQAVSRGQAEAAEAMGLRGIQVYWYVVIPQAVRYGLAGTGTVLVELIKATALLVTISAGGLLTRGTVITSTTFQALSVYIIIAFVYFLMCYPTSQGMLWLERRLDGPKPMSLRRRAWLRSAKRSLSHA